MNQQLHKIIRATDNLAGLALIETRAEAQGVLDAAVQAALDQRSAELARPLVAQRTGLDLKRLTPAEEKIVHAVAVYVGVMKRQGKDATRTFSQIKSRGLIGAAETAVEAAKPTQGFQRLAEEGRTDLSYEQIILEHADEFSPRAVWYARRTLGLPNDQPRAPSAASGNMQQRTEQLVAWLKARRIASGQIEPFTNVQAAAALGWGDLATYGRPYGNLQSRLDFACYRSGLPPLGLAAEKPFDRAWQTEGRSWSFPVAAMQVAAQAKAWSDEDFDRVLVGASGLSGEASSAWRGEMAKHEGNVRQWAHAFVASPGEQYRDDAGAPLSAKLEPTRRNPPWTREELILALDLYLRMRGKTLSHDSAEVVALSEFLGQMQAAQEDANPQTYRNANGVYMKLMNFRRLDPEMQQVGQVGLSRGNSLEPSVWNEFSDDPEGLARAAEAIRRGVAGGAEGEDAYWVFVCNPKRWAADRFLSSGQIRDSWGVRPSDRERFAPGQLGLVRVGVDRRSAKELDGRPALEPGLYALCEVESAAFDGTGASDAFWAEGSARGLGWPTVKLKYLRNFYGRPLTIERLRREAPELSPLLLNGFQAASFPILAADFRRILELLDVSEEELAAPVASEGDQPVDLAALEERYRRASPEVKERVSRTIERGPVGAHVKKANGYKCQLCLALGLPPLGFRKPSGEPYVEAHHVMPVSTKEIGSLAASNIMTVCPNHHRQLHFGGVKVAVSETTFQLELDGLFLTVPRPALHAT